MHLATDLSKAQAIDMWRRLELLRKRPFAQRGSTMKKHEILSPQYRAALFDPPTDPAAIVRHYTFSSEDMRLIRRRRRDANRLGFAVLLAYLRFPGRVLGAQEVPPPDMLVAVLRPRWRARGNRRTK